MTDTAGDPLDQPAPWIGTVAKILAAVLTLAALAWAADLYRTFGLLLIDEQFNAFILALALALVFLTYRVRKHGRGACRGTTSPPP